MGIIAALVITLAPLGAGRLILTRLDANVNLSVAEHLVFALLIGNFCMGLTIWGVGTLVYNPISMAAIVMAFAGLSLFNLLLDRVGPLLEWPITAGRIPVLLAGIILLIAMLGYIGCLAPPSDHDSLRYHLRLPARDLALGRIALIPGWSIYEFLPPLGHSLNHMAYAFGGATTVSALNMTWQLLTGVITGVLAHRLGVRFVFSMLACLFMISQRVSINLSAVASVEFMLTAYCGGLVLCAMRVVRTPTPALAIVAGLLGGGASNVKHSGLVFLGCVLCWLAFRALSNHALRITTLIIIAIAGLATLPWMARNWLLTDNPLFPAFNQMFGDDKIDIFQRLLSTQHPIWDAPLSFLIAPLAIFINPQLFDGLQFGLPIILLFLPFAIPGLLHDWRQMLAIMSFVYFLVWLLAMPLFVRFLLPLFPLFCAVAAVGANTIISAGVRAHPLYRPVMATVLIALVAGQSAFVGATAIRRVPAAIGIVSKTKFLETAPFNLHSQYYACNWITQRLRPGEHYLPLISPPTYYCPSDRAFPNVLPGDDKKLYTSAKLPSVSGAWLADQFSRCRVAYVFISNGQYKDREPLAFATHRYDDILLPAAKSVPPIFHKSHLGKMYRATDLAQHLKANPERYPGTDGFTLPSGNYCNLIAMEKAVRLAR